MTGTSSTSLAALYGKHSVSKDEVFLRYVMAVIYVESRFNRQARSDRDAYGLMQMTRPAVTDAERTCNLRSVGDMAELLDSATNVRYGSCYLKQLYDVTGGDWTRTLVAYNGGFRTLAKYDKGVRINSETASYVQQVHSALQECGVDVVDVVDTTTGRE